MSVNVFVILNAEGDMVSAWPKIGIAKGQCRTELKDKVVTGRLICDDVIVKTITLRGGHRKSGRNKKK